MIIFQILSPIYSQEEPGTKVILGRLWRYSLFFYINKELMKDLIQFISNNWHYFASKIMKSNF